MEINKIINISWDNHPRSAMEVKEDISNGIIFVHAHGNNTPVQMNLSYHGSIPGYIYVGGSKKNLNFNNDFNWGTSIDLCAPSKELATLARQGVNGSNQIICMRDQSSGASFAAPQVTGAVGLMLSVNPNLTPEQIECILKETATPFNPLTYNNTQNYYNLAGSGVLNVYEAVKRAKALAIKSTLVVSGHQIISTSFVSDDDIEITSTGELEINGATISFSLGRKITVRAGGKLRIFNSTLTSNDCTNWEGIKIEGSQTTMQGYQLPTRTHSWLDIRNSTIEFAKIGIETGESFTPNEGGVFSINNSNFVNCRFGIKHNGFIDPSFPNWNPSYVSESQFICNKSIPGYENQGVNTHIWLYNVKGLSLVANSYRNLTNQNTISMGTVGRGRGIGAWEAGFKVVRKSAGTPCAVIGLNSVFEGLGIAVHSGYGSLGNNTTTDFARTTKVYDSEIINNRIGGLFLNDNATVLYNNNYSWDNNMPDMFSIFPTSDPIIGNSYSFSRSGRRTDNNFQFDNINHKNFEFFIANIHQDDGTGQIHHQNQFISSEECKNTINSADNEIKAIADYFIDDINSGTKELKLACNTYKSNLFRAWYAEQNVDLSKQIYIRTLPPGTPKTEYDVDNIWEPCLKSIPSSGSNNISIQNSNGTAFEKYEATCQPQAGTPDASRIQHDYTLIPFNADCHDMVTPVGDGCFAFIANPYCQSSKFYNESSVYCSGPDGIPGTPDDGENDDNGGENQGENFIINNSLLDSIILAHGYSISQLLNENLSLKLELISLHNQLPKSTLQLTIKHALIHFYSHYIGSLHEIAIQNPTSAPNNQNQTSLNNKEKINNDFTIYPNPVMDKLDIKLSNTLEIEKIIIVNTLGVEIIVKNTIQTKGETIDVSKLTSGLYVLHIYNKNGSNLHKIFFKK